MGDATTAAVSHFLGNRECRTIHDPSLAPAAVLLLVYPKDGEYCVLFNKRTETVEHHKGEISFPGGTRDPEDQDFLATALRETHEEMGVSPSDVTILGQLDDVATRSRYVVNVFVGNIPYPYPFCPSPDEIAKVLEIPITQLRSPANLRYEARWEDEKPNRGRSYLYGKHLIFGATARIVQQFLEVVETVPFKEAQ